MAEQDTSVSYQFTKAGNNLSAKALAGTIKIDFTRAELSTTNHFGESEADIAGLTELDGVTQTVDLKEVDVVDNDPSFVKIPVKIDETAAPEDYALLTIGLYCKPDDGDEVLYSICALKDPIYIHKSSTNSTFNLNLNTLVGSSSNVVIKVDPAGAVTNADLTPYAKTVDVNQQLDTKVNVSDMRKPASDVAGIEEVNAKQDKIGYTPADDSKVVHSADMRKPANDVAGIEEVNTKVTDNKDGTEQLNGVQVQPFNKLSDTIGSRNYALNTENLSVVCDGSSNQYVLKIPVNHDIFGNPNIIISYDAVVTNYTGGTFWRLKHSDIDGNYATMSDSKDSNNITANGNYHVVYHGSFPSQTTQLDTLSFNTDLNATVTIKNFMLTIGSTQGSYLPAPEDKADDSKVVHNTGNEEIAGTKTFDTAPIDKTTGNPYITKDGVPTVDLSSYAKTSDVTTAISTAIANMVDSTPPSLTIANDGTYTITAPATTSTPIVKYFLYYNVDGQSDATKLDVGTKLTGSLKELITKPDKTTTYDVQATAMHTNTESGVSNSVQFTYVPIDDSIYGASWDRKSSPTLTRTDAAVGLKAGINGAQNDFDNVGPWKGMHRVTDSMNNVFVRVPKFYIRKTQTGAPDNGTATWQVSLVSHGDDWYLPKGFWDFTNSKELDYIDIGAYDATGSSSKLISVAGKAPLVNLSIVDFRIAAKANGTGYQIWDIHANDMLQVLFIIEFATLNSQSVMEGVDNGTSAAKSGAADSHKGSSGTAGSGSSAMSYRGIENLYGNGWQFCDGVNFEDNQPWVCEDATKFQSDLFASPYVRTSYTATSSGSNYIKTLGFDSLRPYAQFATDDSGSDSTYYADYDWQGSGNTILETGGSWGSGARGGLFDSNRDVLSTYADDLAGCRLLKKALS